MKVKLIKRCNIKTNLKIPKHGIEGIIFAVETLIRTVLYEH